MITMKNAEEHMKRVFDECNALREAGQKEYAHASENALANFERCAVLAGVSREQALLVYMAKHFDGIAAYIKGHKSQRESVTGRINDMIVYLCLFRAMVEDNVNNDKIAMDADVDWKVEK